MSDTISESTPDELIDLFEAWFNTNTWQASYTYLQEHAEQLLSDEAIKLFDELLAANTDAEDNKDESSNEVSQERIAAENEEEAVQNVSPDEDEQAIKQRILLQHRTILQDAHTASIESSYAELLKPSPFALALQQLPPEIGAAINLLMDANNLQELTEQVEQHPILHTDEVTTAIENVLVLLQQANQEDTVIALRERYEALKRLLQPKDTSETIPDELLQLFQEWINTQTWAESYKMLNANSELLLGDETLAALNTLILWNDEDEGLKRTLEQHRTILQEARAASIESAYAELLKPSQSEAIPEDLAQLFQEWIDTQTWAESYEMLNANAERLLSDETLAALNTLILWNDENESAKRTLERHRTILQDARAASIESAYAELLKPSRSDLANALLNASTPLGVRQTVTQYPLLLEEETLRELAQLVEETVQEGRRAVAKALHLRVDEVRRISKQQEQPPPRPLTSPLHSSNQTLKISSSHGGISAFDNSGNVTQINQNVEHMALPEKQWQQPHQQAFNERKDFVGRQDELQTLLQYLSSGTNVTIAGKTNKTIKTATLQGMGGIGKTYLARKLASELQNDFPGGCIWLSVGPAARDLATAQPQLRELASYAFGGQSPSLIDAQLEPERVASWLEAITPGRLLVVLDDVWHLDALSVLNQALPQQATRLVTTRYVNVIAKLGGHTKLLDRLTRADSIALLIDRLGIEDTAPYQTDLEQLAEVLEGHALALDIAAGLIKKPSRLPSILNDLRKEIGRGALSSLQLTESEERASSLERSLALSYDMMNSEQRQCFRALGVCAPDTLITAEIANALWNMDDPAAAEKALFELEDRNLLTEVSVAKVVCYQQHGLLRIYAHALLAKNDELTSTSWTHAGYYTNLVETTEVVDRVQLEPHIPNLLLALQWSLEYEPLLFSQLLARSSEFFLNLGQSALLETYLPHAIEATADNQLQQADLLGSLGDLERRLGNLDQARAHYDTALPLYREQRNRLGEANLLQSLGDLEKELGNLNQARTHYDTALPLFREQRNRLGEANLLGSLGDLESRLGNLDQAHTHYDTALPLYREQRNRLGEANLLKSLAYMFITQEDWPQAQTYCEQALPLYIAERDPLGQANTLRHLGRARFELADYQQGIKDMQKAVELFYRVQDKEWAGYAEEDLAEMQERLELSSDDAEQRVALSAKTWQSLRVLLYFWSADWQTRLQVLKEHEHLLLSDAAEPLFILFHKVLAKAIESAPKAQQSTERLRAWLHYCRAWGIEPGLFFAEKMLLEDNIDIPTQYEASVQQSATLLSQQNEDATAQAVVIMQTLLDRLTADTPPLFEAALLSDLANAQAALPYNHPARKPEQIVTYCREALPYYQAAERLFTVIFIQRLLATTLCEEGRYHEALEPLQAASELLLADEQRQDEAARTLSDYADTLYKVGRLDESLQAYKRALALRPKEAILFRNRAEKLILARRLDEARADLERAVTIDETTDNPYLWLRRAQLAIAEGDGSQAVQMLQEALKHDEDLDLTLFYAQSAWLLGDVNRACEQLKIACESASEGYRAVIRREIVCLLNEHPDLPGSDEMAGIVVG